MIKKTLQEQKQKGSELLIFPELFLVGYPPQSLLKKAWFRQKAEEAVEELRIFSQNFPHTGLLFGVPRVVKNAQGESLFNAAVLICGGKVIFEQTKTVLPSYDLFDEKHYFTPATRMETVNFRGEKLGIILGEDVWSEVSSEDLVGKLKEKGATLLINLASFPFYRGSDVIIYNTFKEHVQKHQLPLVYVNQVGANDELIFAGKSFCLDGEGQLLAVLAPFQEQVLTFDTQEQGKRGSYALQEEIESVYEALVLGIKDYFKKTGFRKALLGLSGGIDSALVCALAVAALGKENVVGISMPSPFSSLGSVEDSRQLAQNLRIDFQVISIARIYETYLNTLQEHFVGRSVDLTEENIQARIRGNLLMAFANKFGYLLLTTGNKSELAVGYCTLYGDMSGGLGVLSDVPKTMVYQLARYLNREKEIIPLSTIEKAPSAELRPEQKDEDTLPPYELLDRLLFLYLEEDYAPEELVQEGFPVETVEWMVKAVARNEYKRRQAVPGLKVNSKPGIMEQRMPLTAQYY